MQKPYLSTVAAVLLMLASALGFSYGSRDASLPTSDDAPAVSESQKTFPNILGAKDKALYQSVFAAQKNANWKKADAAIGQLANPLLMGYVLAERYLHKDYSTSGAELADWLGIYADHPQAYAMYNLAARKAPGLHLPTVTKPASLQGYGDDHGLAASFGDSRHALTWHRAMGEWRRGNKHAATQLFTALAKEDDLPGWKKSAAAFWSYRGLHAAGNRKEAEKYLRIAAGEPRSFYGILARKKLGQSLELDKTPALVDPKTAQEIVSNPAIQRVIALAQIGRGELAESELRILFPRAARPEKERLLALAHALELPSVQIAMARQLGSDARMLDYARYPIPPWQPKSGFKVDRALLFALMRQESGFHAAASSRSGAYGVMQLMPQTASVIKKRMYGGAAEIGILSALHDDADPRFNMALGQDYLKYLLDHDLVEGNLFYLLTAYNAGPGRLMEWKQSIGHHGDPLLFVESIPYAETRHYVMQVMTNYWIYSELAGGRNPSVAALLSGQWPDYRKHAAPIAVGEVELTADHAS